MQALHPELLRVDFENQIIVRADAPVRGKVGVISGGGSGHEPMHGGFVGRGMLDAACPGAIFTSPVPDQMLAATRAVNGGAGVLHVVKNYTGEVLNFEMAAELAAADGMEVASVVTIEDLGLKAGDPVLAFVNGMGGTPLIELYIVANELARILRGRDITITRSLIGSYITSLEMAGCSITLLRLDDEMTRYWDAPVHTAALRWGI